MPRGVDVTGTYDPSEVAFQNPPAGVIPNLAHPESRCWQLYLTAALCMTLSLCFCAYCGVVIAGELNVLGTLGLPDTRKNAKAATGAICGRRPWPL
ncbi:MAG: hypothetical protein Q9181_005174 [Wetmoreana brouardii]